MLSGIKQQGIVGKNGKIEIQAPELAEGTVVEVIVLAPRYETMAVTEREDASPQPADSIDETAYLLSTEANRKQLMDALRAVENEQNLVSFTAKEWDEEYNIHP